MGDRSRKLGHATKANKGRLQSGWPRADRRPSARLRDILARAVCEDALRDNGAASRGLQLQLPAPDRACWSRCATAFVPQTLADCGARRLAYLARNLEFAHNEDGRATSYVTRSSRKSSPRDRRWWKSRSRVLVSRFMFTYKFIFSDATFGWRLASPGRVPLSLCVSEEEARNKLPTKVSLSLSLSLSPSLLVPR